MEIKVHKIGPHKVVAINGDIDLYNVSKLKAAIMDAIDENEKSLIVDMKGIYYMDSSGIGALVAAHKKMKKKRGNFALTNIQDDVMEVIRLASLHRFFHIFKSADSNYSNIPVSETIGSTEAPGEKTELITNSATGSEPSISQNAPHSHLENKQTTAKQEIPKGIIFKGWVDAHTFRTPADGSPRNLTTDILQRKIESKNSAVRMARLLTLEHFVGSFKNNNWQEFQNYRRKIFSEYADIVKKGSAKLTKFNSKQKCTVIFEVKAASLRENILNEYNKIKDA